MPVAGPTGSGHFRVRGSGGGTGRGVSPILST